MYIKSFIEAIISCVCVFFLCYYIVIFNGDITTISWILILSCRKENLTVLCQKVLIEFECSSYGFQVEIIVKILMIRLNVWCL